MIYDHGVIMDKHYSHLISGLCPLGGLVIYDGYLHIGTFCDDGTYVLPIGHDVHLSNRQLTLILYTLHGTGQISLIYKVESDELIQGLVNPCLIEADQRKMQLANKMVPNEAICALPLHYYN